MRLAAKLVLLYLVGLFFIVGVFGYLSLQQNRRLAKSEHERRAIELAAALRPSLQAAWQRGETASIAQILQRSTGQLESLQIRWVELSRPADPRWQPRVPAERLPTRRTVTTLTVIEGNGRPALYTYIPLAGDDPRRGSLEVSAPADATDTALHASLVSSAISLLAVTLFSGLVIVVGGVRMVGRPLNQLIDKIHRVGAGDFSGPVEIEGHDELGRLGIALNQMCTELESQREQLTAETARRVGALQQLRHADRLNTVGRLAAGVAHELGTPLSVVAGRAELIAGGHLSEEAIRQSADVIKQESDRIAQTIRLLLDFARRRTPQRQAIDLRGLVQETVNLLTAIASKQGVTLEVSAPPAAVIAEVDSGQLQQVLTNLVLNAIQATSGTPGERRVEVRVRGEADQRGIEVRDTGTGIAPEDREHLFEPFFTTKDVGEGTGLGLSISDGIIREHDGTIEVTSEPGKGSQFAIWLPAPPAGPSTHDAAGFSY